MGAEGSVGISLASEGCQETLPTQGCRGSQELKPCNKPFWLCSKKLHAVGPEQNFTRAVDLCNSSSEAAARSAGRKQGQKYPLLVVHPEFVYSDILWYIILASKEGLVSWKLPDQLWFDIQQVC